MRFEDNYPHRNKEGYPDPTVSGFVQNVEAEKRRAAYARYKRVMGVILGAIRLAGFEAVSRIVLRDVETGLEFNK